jgi:hypothetical protein
MKILNGWAAHGCCLPTHKKLTNQNRRNMKKINQLLAMAGMAAALFFGTGNVLAQDNGGGGGGGGGMGGGRGNFDPAQMQQRMMERIQDELGFTNATDWSAVQPLVQKVMDAQRDARGNMMARMFGRGNRGGGGDQGGGNRRGMFGGTPSPEAEALQKAVDDNAPAAQVKDLLAKYQASQKDKQAKLAAAQENLRAVLTTKQEAQATLLGLLQ